MEIISQKEKILYIGIDVHKDTYSLCCFDFQKNELSNEMTTKATKKHVIKYLEAVGKNYKEEVLFACGYEAGPTPECVNIVVAYKEDNYEIHKNIPELRFFWNFGKNNSAMEKKRNKGS